MVASYSIISSQIHHWHEGESHYAEVWGPESCHSQHCTCVLIETTQKSVGNQQQVWIFSIVCFHGTPSLPAREGLAWQIISGHWSCHFKSLAYEAPVFYGVEFSILTDCLCSTKMTRGILNSSFCQALGSFQHCHVPGIGKINGEIQCSEDSGLTSLISEQRGTSWGRAT